MRNKFNILDIYDAPATVFTANDLALLWNCNSLDNVKARANYYVKTGSLFSPRKGLYTKKNNYSVLELANKLYKPSYISLDTILFENKVIFQYSQVVTAVSYLSREIVCDRHEIQYFKIKDSVLYDPLGIETRANSSVATLERAFLDALYLNSKRYFDNLRPINWDRCLNIAQIYNNMSLVSNINKLRKDNDAR